MPSSKRNAATSGFVPYDLFGIWKRQKLSDTKPKRIEDAFQFTTQSTESSLLLQLPSELRNAIWDLVYGDKDVVVRHHTTRTRTGERIPKYNIYDRYRKTEQHPNQSHMPKTVSKQFWAETTSVFFSSAVFDFESADTFQNFATSYDKQATIARVTRLRISCGVGWELTIFWAIWGATLNVLTLRPFESLRGFEWIITHYKGGPEEQLRELRLIGNEATWRKSKLRLTIRGFQQLRLRPELTSVRFENYRWKYAVDRTASADIALGGEIREMLKGVRAMLLRRVLLKTERR